MKDHKTLDYETNSKFIKSNLGFNKGQVSLNHPRPLEYIH